MKVVSVTFHAPLDLSIHKSQGLYDPSSEHDACGVGMVTTLNKRPERKIIDDAIEVLVNLNHRGAVGAEENTGDKVLASPTLWLHWVGVGRRNS